MQEKLLLIRKNRNISQKELADFIGISTNQYSAKENGKYNFNCDEMFKISNFLDMNIEGINPITFGDMMDINIEDIFLPTKHQNGVENNSQLKEQQE